VTQYEPFAELYDNRPVLVVREQLRHCATVIQLASEARAKGFEVQFSPGGFVNDVMIREGQNEDIRPKNHTIRSAKRFVDNYCGLY
jgi:hypothetical protein